MSAIDVAADPNFGARPGFGATPPEVEQPSTGDIAAAAFRQTNSVVSAISALRNSGEYEPVPGYNPIDDISSWKNEKYMREHGDRFVGSHSPADTYAIKDQIDTEDNDKNILAASGKTGFVAQTMAGMLDPTMLLPGGVGIDAAKGGLTFTKAAIETGKAGFLATTAQEALLHGSQQTRTYEESALNVASGTLLSAMIGGGASAFLHDVSPARAKIIADAPEGIRDIAAANHVVPEAAFAEGGAPIESVPSFDEPGVNAYHGSPYDFDTFSSDKIGTGEGAAAYGHGLYFAEEPQVAKDYQKLLSGKYEDDADSMAHHALIQENGDRAAAAKSLLDRAKAEEADIVPGVDPKMLRRAADRLQNGWEPSQGSLYQVRIKADQNSMLDWDKPLNEQPANVQRAIEKMGVSEQAKARGDETGKSLLDIVANEVLPPGQATDANISKAMQDAGIHGIRYFDAGSRATGEGTRNVVVFDPDHVQITHKNGQPVKPSELPQHLQSPAIGIKGQRATVEAKLAADRHEMNEHAGNPGTGEVVPPAIRVVKTDTPVFAGVLTRPDDVTATHYDLVDSSGEVIGFAHTSHKEGSRALNIDNIEVWDGPNSVGTSATRSIIKQLHAHNPDVDTIGGLRISGARQGGQRAANDAEGVQATLNMRRPEFAKTEEGIAGSLQATPSRPPKPIATIVKEMTQNGSDAPMWRYTQSDLEEARQIHQEAVWRNHQVERSGFTVRFEANAKEMLDKIEAALPPKNITENITQPAGTGQAMAAGAASSDTRKLELVDFGLNQVPGLRRVIEKTSPMQRVFGADSPTARRTGADLAETSLLFKQNLQGEVTTAGPALDREARLMIHQGQVATGDALSKLFSEYRYGEQVRAPRMRAGFEDMTGRAAEGRMSFSEFKEAVSDAMRSGDKHEIPQVEQAAQLIRQKVFEPWKKRAIEAGLLPEDVDVKTADSYLSRLYNKQAIAAKRPEFVDRTTDWLQADQAAKAQAQQKISAYHGAMQSHAATIEKINGKIASLEGDADVIAARHEESTRFNKAANQRARKLREGADQDSLPLKNAQGGAVFETLARNRGNLLADRASAKLAEIETLEQKLATETASHDAMRGKLEEEIGKWEGKSTKEAQAALKARGDAEQARAAAIAAGTSKSKGERLGSADKAVDRAVARIMGSDRDLTRDELRSRAQEITDRIIGAPDGRLPYDLGMEHGTAHGGSGEAPRGALAAREFNIPDKTIADFLEHDIEHIIGSHLKTMVPDVLLTEKFGDTRMTEAFRKINDEYAAMTDAAKSEKERTGLEKERQGVIDDLAAIRDRIRGTYGMSSEAPLRNAARAANVLKNYNVLTSMGSAALSSLPDMAGSVLRHGLTSTFQDAWVPFFKMLTQQSDAWQAAAREYRAMGIAVESVLASRHHALTDTLDTYHPQSRVERTMQWATGKFQFVNMLAPWTDFAKINASMVAGSELLRAVKAASEGSATARQLRNLGESGVEPHMADRIAKAFETGGEVRDGVHLPNTADWTDAEAKRVFEGAIARDVDIAVVTPGQEKPLFMSHPLLGVLAQFKSFTAAATERVLISNIQRRDAQVLQGVIFSMGLGMLSYKLNSLTGGAPTSDRPQDWIKEAISRGNLLGWIEEANALASKTTSGGVDIYRMIGADKPLSRYASRTASDQLLGPTKGKIDAIIGAVHAASHPSEWNEADSKAIRRLVASQNVFYLRRLFDQVEAAGNNAFGIPMKAKVK